MPARRAARRRRYHDLRRGDATRAREELGWEPKVQLEEGLKLTLASIQQD